MTDDLVERLLDWPYQGETMAHEAAARIEQLTAELDALVQTSAILCDDCGWAMNFPDLGCVYCGFHRLEKERERLALAICGGEDAPGYANAQTVETLEHVAKQNQQSHGETINSLLAAEAERDAANALLRRITRNVDADGVGTVLIIDLQAARAHLGAKP